MEIKKIKKQEPAVKNENITLLLAFLCLKLCLTVIWLSSGKILDLNQAEAETKPSGLILSNIITTDSAVLFPKGTIGEIIIDSKNKENNNGSNQILPSNNKNIWGLKEAWAQTAEKNNKETTKPSAAVPPALSTNSNRAEKNIPVANSEQELIRKEISLKAKEKALGGLETDLNKKLIEIDAAKFEIERLVQRNEEILAEQKSIEQAQKAQDEELKNARVEHLVTAYRSMRPEQAGNLINSMDDDIAVAILSAMPGRSAGLILAHVIPDKAARLTKAISEQRIDPNLLLNEATKTLPTVE